MCNSNICIPVVTFSTYVDSSFVSCIVASHSLLTYLCSFMFLYIHLMVGGMYGLVPSYVLLLCHYRGLVEGCNPAYLFQPPYYVCIDLSLVMWLQFSGYSLLLSYKFIFCSCFCTYIRPLNFWFDLFNGDFYSWLYHMGFDDFCIPSGGIQLIISVSCGYEELFIGN